MSAPPQPAPSVSEPPPGVVERRYVQAGRRIVPLSVLLAVVFAIIAAYCAWRLYSPTWAGGVGRTIEAPQPSASKVENAPGPDNSLTTLPPPELRSPPTANDKGKKP